MFKRFLSIVFATLAISVAAAIVIGCSVFIIHWAQRPSSGSAEGLLKRADEFAWNNDWLAAAPLYRRAEQMFRTKGDQGHALYASVSQFPLKMEAQDLAGLIAQLRADLSSPAASAPEVKLRVLEMKAKCEEEYDAAIASKTFGQVEALALSQHQLYLASRASGEIGILAFTLGNLKEATGRVKQAYIVAKFLGDPAAHVRYAEMIGAGMVQLGQPKQAFAFLDEAIDTQKRHQEVALPFVAYSAKMDALTSLQRYREALELSDQAIVRPRAYQMFGQLQSLLTSRGDVLVAEGKVQPAIDQYQEALIDAHKIGSWRAVTDIESKLAAAYEKAGALGKALAAIDAAIEANKQTPRELILVPGNLAFKARLESELGNRPEAERLYEKGADVIDALLTRVPTPEVERLLIGELGGLYSGYFELLCSEGRYSDAYRVIEQAHGRIETQELQFDKTAIPQYSTEADLHLRNLELNLLNTDDQHDRQNILRKIENVQDENDLRIVDQKPAPLEIMQKQLHPEELLIEYVLGASHSYALVVGPSKTQLFVLPPENKIEQDLKSYRSRIKKYGFDKALGQQLYGELLGFTSAYPSSKSLIIVADGDLHLLPFSALVDESGRYLVETRAVSMAPSGTVLHLLRDRLRSATANSRPYLGVAPWTDTPAQPWILKSVSRGSTDGGLAPLPQSRDEVESIATMMPKPATVLIGPAATKKHFESLPLSDYRVVHLAIHGFADPLYPDRSALVFKPSDGDDGHLAARDIRHLRLKADLVTLSACDTAVGPIGAAGLESIHTAFIEAGANSVVSTLWDLEDRSSDEFMKDFHKHLGRESKTEALRDAELDLSRSGSAPYYWASYELVGDPTGGEVLAR